MTDSKINSKISVEKQDNEKLNIEKLDNGLTVIIEELPYTESVSFQLFIPGGIIYDKSGFEGASILLSPLLSRGAGNFDSVTLQEKFDDLGASHYEATFSDSYCLAASVLADNFLKTLHLFSLLVMDPKLSSEDLPAIKSLALQEVKSLFDNPSQLALQELSKAYFKDPFNRSSYSSKEVIEKVEKDYLCDLFAKQFQPNKAVLSIAGKFNTKVVKEEIFKIFAHWNKDKNVSCPVRPIFQGVNSCVKNHVTYKSAQTQIALTYESAKITDEKQYYIAKVANGILSNSMSGRLFIEVREKRGLCYHVSSKVIATKDSGRVLVYAGTTPDRAKETLEVTINEISSVVGTIKQEELDRSKINLVAGLFIGSESSSSRASFNGNDYWNFGRVRSLNNIKEEIMSVSIDDVDNHLNRFIPKDFTVVTLGEKAL